MYQIKEVQEADDNRIRRYRRWKDSYEQKRSDGQMMSIIGDKNVALRKELGELRKSLLIMKETNKSLVKEKTIWLSLIDFLHFRKFAVRVEIVLGSDDYELYCNYCKHFIALDRTVFYFPVKICVYLSILSILRQRKDLFTARRQTWGSRPAAASTCCTCVSASRRARILIW